MKYLIVALLLISLLTARNDSYGNEYFEDMDYDRIRERVIAAKEIFFEGYGGCGSPQRQALDA